MKSNWIIAIISIALLGSCKTPEARKPVSRTSGSFFQESVQRNKKLIKKEEEQIMNLIHNDSSNNYLSSTNGFWYYYNTQQTADSLIKPDFGDLVTFTYDISTLEGKPIYTKTEIGMREYVMDKELLFTGMRQGLKLMKEGETATFLFPSHTAFGYYGDNDRIGQNVPIRSTVTLTEVVPDQEEDENNNPKSE